jgi:hypothetical protein
MITPVSFNNNDNNNSSNNNNNINVFPFLVVVKNFIRMLSRFKNVSLLTKSDQYLVLQIVIL